MSNQVSATKYSNNGSALLQGQSPLIRYDGSLKENVSKTFKRMLTQNYQRGYHLNGTAQPPTDAGGPDSTMSAGTKLNPEVDQSSINTDIENKFVKRTKRNQKLQKKSF